MRRSGGRNPRLRQESSRELRTLRTDLRRSENRNRALAAEIARRRKTEDSLRESERRYRGLFARTNTAIVILDPQTGRIIDANRPALWLYGYSRREFLALELSALAPNRAEFRRYVSQVLRRGSVTNWEGVRHRRDGRAIIVSINAVVIPHARRRAILAVVRDVTDRERIAEAVRKSEQMPRAARDASLDAFYVHESVRDKKGRIVDFRFIEVNRRGAKFVGLRRKDMVGRGLCELFPMTRANGYLERFARVVETGRPLVEVFPVPSNIPRIRAKWMQHQAVKVGDGIAITARDVTREKRDAEMHRHFSWRVLKAQEAERRRVARDLHDSVSQVLAAARFRLQSAESHASTTDRGVRTDLARAREAVIAAALEVRRISHRLRPHELDDLGFVAAVRTLCREFARQAGIEVALTARKPGERLPAGVEETFYRIVQESLTNVERHARARSIQIDFGRRAELAWLRVRDDGRGFDVDRVDGSGAGLRNMEERAAQAGGKFSCRPARPHGTEIFVELPLDHGTKK